MHDSALAVFLLSLALLLVAARAGGALVQRFGLPALVGEILVGVVVGKTVLGRAWPAAYEWLFTDTSSGAMLQGYKTLAVILLLTIAGLELELGLLRRRRRALALTALGGAVVPFALGFAAGLLLPERYLAAPEQRTFYALFLGIALAISALPVITRTLLDLGLLRQELGGLVLSAAVINDLLGWLCFGALVRVMSGDQAVSGIVLAIVLTAGFALLVFVLVRPLASWWLRAAGSTASTASALSMLIILSVGGAAVAELLGLHAVFGGFLVGLAVGRSAELPEAVKRVFVDCVSSLFTPVFFATMALRYDFVRAFDWFLVALVLVLAIVAKVGGGALGAQLGGVRGRAAWAVGFGLSSRGAMEILLAAVALEAGIINETMFVALVTMAVVTSVIAGPAMARLLGLTPVTARASQSVVRVHVERHSS